MIDFKVSSKYAAALLDISEDKKNLDIISEDMELIYNVIESNKNLIRLLENPVVKPEVKSSILTEIFKSKISNDSLEFINFVVDKNRENFLVSIIKRFLELRDEKLGIVYVVVKTPFEFNDDQKNQLKNKLENLTNKKIRFKFQIDKDIIGGFIAKAGDTVYDASINHQLDLLKKKFLQGGALLN